jgi:RNA polymerase sigma-70 factor (ECF subfamily)
MGRFFHQFDEALLACHVALYRYARSLTRDPVWAEELVQGTFQRALAARRRPRPFAEDTTRAWLFAIARNLWHNEMRQRMRWKMDSLEPADEMVAEAHLDVQRELLQSEVRQAIDSLPEPFREVLVLRDIEGLSYANIAAVLECPVGTVMSRLARAREALRRLLTARTPDPKRVRQ